MKFLQKISLNSLFRLMSLIYVEKFKFENPAIMKDKQCKQIEWYSVMAKGSDCFLLLDDKSKQRYKVKINNIQGHDPYQIKTGKFSGNICKFPLVQWHSLLIIVNYFLVWVSPLRKSWKSMKFWSPTISLHHDGSRK